MMGPYWSLATSFLSGTGAAGGIALINTIANAGGVLSPSLMGWMRTATGSFAAGQVDAGVDHAHRQCAWPSASGMIPRPSGSNEPPRSTRIIA